MTRRWSIFSVFTILSFVDHRGFYHFHCMSHTFRHLTSESSLGRAEIYPFRFHQLPILRLLIENLINFSSNQDNILITVRMTMHSHLIPSSLTLADTEVPQFNNKTRLQLIPAGFLVFDQKGHHFFKATYNKIDIFLKYTYR